MSSGLTKTTADFATQLALGQVHRVGDREDDEARVRNVRPVEEVVEYVLALREHLVELVDEHHPVRTGKSQLEKS